MHEHATDHREPARREAELLPFHRKAHVARVFSWYTARLFNKRFAAVRLARGSADTLAKLDAHPGPAICLGNHPGWWDPLAAILLSRLYLPRRPIVAPMDIGELRRFKVFRAIGLFGIDPDDPAALDPMAEYVQQNFEREPTASFWITPQGRFTDVRAPIRLRPGAAAVAARCSANDEPPAACSLAMEFGFWDDQYPQAFFRVQAFEPPEDPASTTAWLRTMTRAMRTNQEALARLVIARDPAGFETIGGRGVNSSNIFYDLYLRLRGKSGTLGDDRARRRSDRSDPPAQPTNPRGAA
jgi:1-acyl-sn-glycerol-3-phosphate acyltransferase